MASLHVEARYPGAFYCPARWQTSDGCMPYKVCWIYFHFLQSGLALDALTTARGIGLAFADPESGSDALGDAFTQAYPRAR